MNVACILRYGKVWLMGSDSLDGVTQGLVWLLTVRSCQVHVSGWLVQRKSSRVYVT